MSRDVFSGEQPGMPAQEKGRGRDFSKGHERYDFDVIQRGGFKRRLLGGLYLKFWSSPKVRTVAT